MLGTPYEGGVRAPAFIVDYSENQKFLSSFHHHDQQHDQHHYVEEGDNHSHIKYRRVYHGLMHVSDWVPTLLSYANVLSSIDSSISTLWDGYDFSNDLKEHSVNEEIATINYHLNTSCPTVRIPHDDDDGVGTSTSPRHAILIDMYDSNNSVFKESLVSYR
jgi:hypothetical protein